jgi:ribosome-binding factor A
MERVRELLKRTIGEVIRREISISEGGMISVQDVEVSGDLHHATVFVSIVGTQDQQRRGLGLLHKECKRIQALVARSVVLKYMPRLRFEADHSIERGNRVLQIIDELEQTSPP